MDLSVRRPTKTQTFFLNINVLREVIPVANSHPYCQMRITPASREPITILCSLYFQSPCESDPCKNGADCVPEYELNSYRCHCKLGFCGTHCEQKGTSLEKNKQTIKDREAICFLRPFLGGCVLGGGRGWRTDAKWLSSMAGMILRWKIGNLKIDATESLTRNFWGWKLWGYSWTQ